MRGRLRSHFLTYPPGSCTLLFRPLIHCQNCLVSEPQSAFHSFFSAKEMTKISRAICFKAKIKCHSYKINLTNYCFIRSNTPWRSFLCSTGWRLCWHSRCTQRPGSEPAGPLPEQGPWRYWGWRGSHWLGRLPADRCFCLDLVCHSQLKGWCKSKIWHFYSVKLQGKNSFLVKELVCNVEFNCVLTTNSMKALLQKKKGFQKCEYPLKTAINE